MPEDIFGNLWQEISGLISDDVFACTIEIYDELVLLPGAIGTTIQQEKSNLVLEIEDPNWDWESYVSNSSQMLQTHHDYISEYNGGSPKTINLTDLSIIALAKTLSLPVISMEADIQNSPNKRRIPNICALENVEHLYFNDFLRKEGISF